MAMLASKHGRARNVNVNLNTAGGDKKQGLPPSSVEHTRLVKTRAGGENRNLVFCINQLGGVGRGKSQFKVNGSNNPDGVKSCVPAPFSTTNAQQTTTNGQDTTTVEVKKDKNGNIPTVFSSDDWNYKEYTSQQLYGLSSDYKNLV